METTKRIMDVSRQSSKRQKTKHEKVISHPVRVWKRAIQLAPQWFFKRPAVLSERIYYELSRKSNHNYFLLFKRKASEYVRDFLAATVEGEEVVVLDMLTKNPGLLLERGHIEKGITTDYSGRKYSGKTAFQLALCAGDEVLAMKMKAIFLKAYPETGQAELDSQFAEIFPEGYEAHVRAQKAKVEEFERLYVNPLIDAIDGIDSVTGEINLNVIDDLIAAKQKRDNGSKLCQALNQFREAFTRYSMSDEVYNPYYLLNAYKKYDESYYGWNAYEIHRRSSQKDLFWCQGIGFMQRFMTAIYGQTLCTGLHKVVISKEAVRRELLLRQLFTNNPMETQILPCDTNPKLRLGFDFAVESYSWGSISERAQPWLIEEKKKKTGIVSMFASYIDQKNNIFQSMDPNIDYDLGNSLCRIM